MSDKVKIQKGERVLYVKSDAVANMEKFGFKAEGSVATPKKEATRKRATSTKKKTEVVSDESTDE